MTDIHPLGNTRLRTPETWERYNNPARAKPKAGDCFICEAPSVEGFDWTHWRIIANDYPYDAVAEKHMMLVPRRHVEESHWLDEDEAHNLRAVKTLLASEGIYDAMIENLPRGRTFMPHYHLHLIQWKRN